MRRVVSNVILKNKQAFLVSFLTLTTVLATIFVRWSIHTDLDSVQPIAGFDEEASFYFDFNLDSTLVEILSGHDLAVHLTSDCECKKNTFIKLKRQDGGQFYDVYLVSFYFYIDKVKKSYLVL